MEDRNNTKRILILGGPPGSSKETAVRAICREANPEIIINEWKNPSDRFRDELLEEEIMTLPSEFVNFNSIRDDTCSQFIRFIHESTLFGENNLVLVKEYPHILEQYKDEFEQIIIKARISPF